MAGRLERKLLSLDATMPRLALEGRTVRGYASVFNVLDNHGDIMMPGCFAESLATRAEKIRHLWQHESEKPVGVPTLREDAKGLWFETTFPEGDRFDAYLNEIKAGLVTDMSIGFWTKAFETFDDDNLRNQLVGMSRYMEMRRITNVKLVEISSVTFGSNEEAGVEEVRDAFGVTCKRLRSVVEPEPIVIPDTSHLDALAQRALDSLTSIDRERELRRILDNLSL